MVFEYLLRNVPGSPSFRHVCIIDSHSLSGASKRRVLSCPNEEMRFVHKRLIKALRSADLDLPYATACRPGCSVLASLRRHSGNRFFYSLDLADAYSSVDLGRLATILAEIWRDEATLVLNFLREYCLGPDGGLAVGAPASPDLFNLYAGLLLDQPLAERVVVWGGCYTRYLDDILISLPGGRGVIGKRKRETVREMIANAGFGISHHKVRIVDLEQRPILVNGFGLDRNGRIFVPDPFLRRLRRRLLAALAGETGNERRLIGHCSFLFGGKPRLHTRLESEVYRLYRQWQKTRRS